MSDLEGQYFNRILQLEAERDQLKGLYDQAMKTNHEQALHSIEQRKEIEIIKSTNEFLSKGVDDRQKDIDLLRSRVERLEDALEDIKGCHKAMDWEYVRAKEALRDGDGKA